MKKYAVLLPAFFILQGCSSADLNQIASDTMSDTIDNILNSSTASSPSSGNTYSVENEDIQLSTASKTRKDYGKITIVKTEKNPKGQTRLSLHSCTHPRIGQSSCGGYLYEVTEEGWLKDDPITFDDLNYPELTIPAGTYYLKAHNWDEDRNRYVTGTFTIEPFVTNLVDLELE